MSQSEHKPEATRVTFPDGSALVTYPDGSLLIVESNLAQAAALREGGPVNYNDPPPPPAGARRS